MCVAFSTNFKLLFLYKCVCIFVRKSFLLLYFLCFSLLFLFVWNCSSLFFPGRLLHNAHSWIFLFLICVVVFNSVTAACQPAVAYLLCCLFSLFEFDGKNQQQQVHTHTHTLTELNYTTTRRKAIKYKCPSWKISFSYTRHM